MATPSNASYRVLQDGDEVKIAPFASLRKAIAEAEKRLSEGESQVTFSVVNEDNYLLAARTNRRIIGRFTMQAWDARDKAVEMGTEEFDATDHILLMKPDEVRALQDDHDKTDEIGLAHVSWDGPHYVTLVAAICDFFGVSDIRDITDEALADAKARHNPQLATEQTITLSVKVNIRVAAGASVSEFIENLDYSVTSLTPGVTVRDTEIVDAS